MNDRLSVLMHVDASFLLWAYMSSELLEVINSHLYAMLIDAQGLWASTINIHGSPKFGWWSQGFIRGNPRHKWFDSTHGSWFWEKFPPRSVVLWRNPCCAWAGFDGPSLYPPLFWDPVTRWRENTHGQKKTVDSVDKIGWILHIFVGETITSSQGWNRLGIGGP